MNKSKYDVQILVDGKQVKEYSKDGKVFVEAKFGTQYSVRIKNNTNKRVLAIVSVDGINAITGEIAKPDSTGYVINAYKSEEIKGYRQSQDGGAKFKFAEKAAGYAKEVDGHGTNSGVIGVLFVEEKEPEYLKLGKLVPDFPDNIQEPFYPERPDKWPRPSRRPLVDWTYRPEHNPVYFGDNITCRGDDNSGSILRSMTKSVGYVAPMGTSDMAETSQVRSVNYCAVVDQPVAQAQSFDSATTWGDKFEQAMTYVDFVRSDKTETVNVYYATRESLKSMKVITDDPPALNFPQSFPGFAKPPANWKG